MTALNEKKKHEGNNQIIWENEHARYLNLGNWLQKKSFKNSCETEGLYPSYNGVGHVFIFFIPTANF